MTNQESSFPQSSLDAALKMGWQDLLLPVITSGTLMLVCFYIGNYGFSILWIILLTSLYLLKTRLWVSRQESRLQMRKQILRERGLLGIVGATNKELPNWIKYPDSQNVEWINQMLLQLWPYISEYSATFLREFVEPQVLVTMPSPFKSFRFTEMDAGDMPFKISGLKVYTQNVGRDKIIVDMDVVYAGDAEYKVKVMGFTGGMNEIVLSGRLRCILQPLIPHPPMIAGISGSFIELPKFDFNLTGMGDFLQLPLLSDAIRSVVNAQLANLCVLPNSMIIPLVPDINITKLYVPLPDGVLRLKIVEAGNLENKDISFITKDKSDPYCELQLGSQLFRTRTINNNLNPKFDEFFEAIVDQVSAQKLRINVFDHDTTGSDEELGHLSIPMSYVESSKVISKWFNLESCKHGTIYLKLFWCQLSSRLPQTISYSSEWKTANRPVHSTIMVVFVDHVKDLPLLKSNVEPSPLIELTLNNAVQRTPVQTRTTSPVYQSKFLFLIKESQDKNLQRALDSNTNKQLGDLSIPLNSILETPEMEVFDKVYSLRQGVHAAEITLTIRIRHILPPDEMMSDNDLSSYANASFVERAERAENSVMTNGDVLITEPAKRQETDPQLQQEGQTQLNTGRFTSLNRQPSISNVSTSSSKQTSTSKRFKKKFLRFRKPNKRASITDLGLLEYGLRYNDHTSNIILDIISVHNLVPFSSTDKMSPYVSVKMFQSTSVGQVFKAKRRTNIIENTVSPMFDNRFEFEIVPDELNNYKFLIIVKDNSHGILSKAANLGQAEIVLTNFSKSDTLRHKVNLEMP